ncbi:MAG: sugar ABC transporter permease [Bifidobacteriaceae bacterium]|nr:sugar ABC transporter permease [Bifidobacteriaceae bacterium]
MALKPAGIAWILPAFVLSVGVIYFCIGYSAVLSVHEYRGGLELGDAVGLDNYRTALTNPLFWGALRHTLIFFVAVSAVQITMGIVFAALLHSRVRCAVVFKVIIFLPVVIAPAIMSPVHRRVFATQGPINWLLEHSGLDFLAQPWLAQTSTSLWVVIGVQVWSSIGFAFILFFASMGQIDPSIIEAARIDGASNLRILRSLVVPSVRGTTIALLILNVITSLKLFDYPYLLTRGGPVYSSDFLGTYIHREAVALTNLGYASALAILLLVAAIGTAVAMSLRARER